MNLIFIQSKSQENKGGYYPANRSSYNNDSFLKDRNKYAYSYKENDRVSQDQGRNRNRSPINYAAEAARYN